MNRKHLRTCLMPLQRHVLCDARLFALCVVDILPASIAAPPGFSTVPRLLPDTVSADAVVKPATAGSTATFLNSSSTSPANR